MVTHPLQIRESLHADRLRSRVDAGALHAPRRLKRPQVATLRGASGGRLFGRAEDRRRVGLPFLSVHKIAMTIAISTAPHAMRSHAPRARSGSYSIRSSLCSQFEGITTSVVPFTVIARQLRRGAVRVRELDMAPIALSCIRGADIGVAQQSLPQCTLSSPETMTADDAADVGRVRTRFGTCRQAPPNGERFWVADLVGKHSAIAKARPPLSLTIQTASRSRASFRRARCAVCATGFRVHSQSQHRL